MKVQDVARQQLGFWHGTSHGIMSDCGEAMNKQVPGATISSIGSIYAHMVFSEDAIVNGLLQGQPMLYESQGWAEKTGVPSPGNPPSLAGDWAKDVRFDYATFKPYADAVFTNTDAYLASLPDQELERKVQFPFGEQTVGWVATTLLGTHAPQHIGEIAALKGVQGLKGLPF